MRDTFGGFALIQRCQVHKGRNIIERLDPSLHAGVKKGAPRQWDSPTVQQAERVLKNLARSITMPLASRLRSSKGGRDAHRHPPAARYEPRACSTGPTQSRA